MKTEKDTFHDCNKSWRLYPSGNLTEIRKLEYVSNNKLECDWGRHLIPASGPCGHVHSNTYLHTHACTYKHIYTSIHILTHTCTHTSTHLYTYLNTHPHIHKHIYSHTSTVLVRLLLLWTDTMTKASLKKKKKNQHLIGPGLKIQRFSPLSSRWEHGSIQVGIHRRSWEFYVFIQRLLVEDWLPGN